MDDDTQAKTEMKLQKRLWLWLRIVGRQHWGERRYGPLEAWQTAKLIYP